jgi:phage tail-like protein
MAQPFETRLLDLLPPLYRLRDDSGDLAAFLRVPGASLDELKDLIDRFPLLFDVDRCEERWLPYLAQVVGLPFDPRRSPAENRRRIREAVPLYRRKGTIPAIRRSLTDLGWQGQVEETFHAALRLNRRSRLDSSRLPGRIYSLGVWRVLTELDAPGVRGALPFHHPAGTRVFFLAWLREALALESESGGPLGALVRRVALGFLEETFHIGRDPLGSCRHLTRKQKTWGVLELHTGVTLDPEIERADVCLERWHGRGNRMRLNTRRLGVKRLQNVWVSERKFAGCCKIETRKRPPVPPVFMRLAAPNLNGARLNNAEVACRIRFRQVDFYSELAQELPASLGKQIHCTEGYPELTSGFECSVPGLHFLGAPAAASFGPLMRFVSGSAYAAAALARCVTGEEKPQTTPWRSGWRLSNPQER